MGLSRFINYVIIIVAVLCTGITGASTKAMTYKNYVSSRDNIHKPESNLFLQKKYPTTFILSGPQTSKKVALTFDDGPDPRFTPQLLDLLQEYQLKVTFFLLGSRAEKYPELVKRMVEDGHVVANHTHSHQNLVKIKDTSTTESEIVRTETIIKEVTGEQTKLFRAPYGFLTSGIIEKLDRLEYTIVGWSIDSLDWQETEPVVIATRSTKDLHSGAIILLHDGAEESGNRINTLLALPLIIDEIKKRGFEIVTVPELLQ